jgi:uncharacterized protein (DUF608 family)
MPVGGVCCGQLYLGADGRLWLWEIFNHIENSGSGGPHYAAPMEPSSPFAQGFAVRVQAAEGPARTRPLDASGWSDVRFRGEYPVGLVTYRDPACPVAVDLEAFSPFVPLDANDSALPATVLRYTVRNTSAAAVKVRIAGWLENAVLLHSGRPDAVTRVNRISRSDTRVELTCGARIREEPVAKRPEIVFEEFEKATYEGWTSEGTAFGAGPVEESAMPGYQGKIGARGRRLVNSHASAPGEGVTAKDAATGRLTSRPFRIERSFIRFLAGGGPHKTKTCVNLLVDGKAVLSQTGSAANTLSPRIWDVRRWTGREARIEIVDDHGAGWGNIGVDHIVFSDDGGPDTPLKEERDAGTMALAMVAGPADGAAGVPRLHGAVSADAVFAGLADGIPSEAELPWGEGLCGAVGRTFDLAPDAVATVTFVVAWHFPNLPPGLPGRRPRHYARRFGDAAAVADHVIGNLDRLSRDTRLWRDTWYDSTLPVWFLDRTFAPTAHLATNTCVLYDDGRFYAWEGVGCCPGTCTHVWHYAQAMSRIFPELERSLRERVDLGVAFDGASGSIGFRGELHKNPAIDGQAGVILRMLREHRMSADDAFLRRLWPRTKAAMQFLIRRDVDADGILEGPQHNTLDADWFGRSSWLSGMYLAALRAGEEMARETGDSAFAEECRAIFERGRAIVDRDLFNGEYYIHEPDPAHTVIGSYDGCHVDQVLGQGWAWQLDLGRIHDEAKTRRALQSLWRYNFVPDVGPFREANKPGRWYAMAGEGGLLMCTWPRGEARRVRTWSDGYFNECMSGFEHQAAGHMIAEGMIQEGLAVTRAIHDRYHPSRRNPWNEVECGDHYGRALASYGTYLAACGFDYNGPAGRIGFAPRLTPGDFRCAFTAAEGWGTFVQKSTPGTCTARIELRWGRLRVKTVALKPPDDVAAWTARVAMAGGTTVEAALRVGGGRVSIDLAEAVVLTAGSALDVTLHGRRP